MPQPALPPLSTHLTMTAGADVHAVVTLKDRHGNTRASGGEVVRLLMSSPKRVSLAEVTDEKDGSYTCAFEAIDAGDVQAFLSVNGHAVEIKAPPLLVLPASPDALTLTTHRLQHKFWPAPNLGAEAIAAQRVREGRCTGGRREERKGTGWWEWAGCVAREAGAEGRGGR